MMNLELLNILKIRLKVEFVSVVERKYAAFLFKAREILLNLVPLSKKPLFYRKRVPHLEMWQT